MANQRQRQIMQEAIDEQVTPERLRQLQQSMDTDPDQAAEYNRLRQVDRYLKTAPMEQAPEGLALRVLARLAEGLQSQTMMRPTSLALAIGLAAVALALMPMIGILGSLLISALGNAAVLSALISQVVSLLATIANTMSSVVESAQMLLQTYPEAPVVIVTLVPAALFWIWRASRNNRTATEP